MSTSRILLIFLVNSFFYLSTAHAICENSGLGASSKQDVFNKCLLCYNNILFPGGQSREMTDGLASALGTANANCQNLANSWCIQGDALQGCPKTESKTPVAENDDKGLDPPAKTTPAPATPAAPKTTPAATKPPNGSTPDPSAKATQQQCDDSAKAVEDCCSHPERCGGAQASTPTMQQNQSMTDYCNQMNSAAASNASANNAAAASCKQRIETCSTTCTSAGDSETAQGCKSQASKWQTLVSQAKTSAGSGLGGDACKTTSQAQPQSAGGAPSPNQNSNDPNKTASNDPNDPSGCKNNPTGAQCQKCTANPNDPSCGTAMQKGQSAFSDNNDKPMDKSGFDIPTASSASHSMFDQASIPTGQAPKNGTIANNSGGSIPGLGGGGAASLGGGGQKKPGGGGGSGVSTDILQGNMPGGYTTSPGGSAEADGGGGWGGYGGRMPASASGTGMDLKQFLPGQKKAPAFVGGAYSMQSAEIAGKHGDIFEKISRKFHEKCLQGQLIGCDR